jgi:SpoIIAA-like
MIEKIPGLSDDVLGFSAKGTVTAKDYETVIIPAVEARFARQKDKVRFLYLLGKEFTGFEVAAMWDDAKLGLAMPGRARVFHERELDDAKRWLSE